MGGSFENRIRFPLEIVQRTREAVDAASHERGDFLIIFRLSCLDLVEDGSSFDEVVELGQRVEEAGASMINTGIGWHEARVPTNRHDGSSCGICLGHRQTAASPENSRHNIKTASTIHMWRKSILRDGISDMVSMAKTIFS